MAISLALYAAILIGASVDTDAVVLAVPAIEEAAERCAAALAAASALSNSTEKSPVKPTRYKPIKYRAHTTAPPIKSGRCVCEEFRVSSMVLVVRHDSGSFLVFFDFTRDMLVL
jgi:hypothetical protein